MQNNKKIHIKSIKLFSMLCEQSIIIKHINSKPVAFKQVALEQQIGDSPKMWTDVLEVFRPHVLVENFRLQHAVVQLSLAEVLPREPLAQQRDDVHLLRVRGFPVPVWRQSCVRWKCKLQWKNTVDAALDKTLSIKVWTSVS